MNEIVPRKTLVNQGSKGVGGIVGGTALLILNAVSGGIPSLIIGGIIGIFGLSMLRSKGDRLAAMVVTAAGALTAVSFLLPGIASTLLLGSGIGLLIMGGWNLLKFIRGYRKRT